MWTTDEFAFCDRGDLTFVIFYGDPVNGVWEDRLCVSERFIELLFAAIGSRVRDSQIERKPRLVEEWYGAEGAFYGGICEINRSDSEELVRALVGLTPEEVASQIIGFSYAHSVFDPLESECLRCAKAIQRFIAERFASGGRVFVGFGAY